MLRGYEEIEKKIEQLKNLNFSALTVEQLYFKRNDINNLISALDFEEQKWQKEKDQKKDLIAECLRETSNYSQYQREVFELLSKAGRISEEVLRMDQTFEVMDLMLEVIINNFNNVTLNQDVNKAPIEVEENQEEKVTIDPFIPVKAHSRKKGLKIFKK
jgi:hypothetical protein